METFLLIIETLIKEKGHLHPLIVHFPITLFFVAPIFMLIGWISDKNRISMFIAAAIILIIACISLQSTLITGEAASKFVPKQNDIIITLGQHDNLAHQCRLWFFSLTGVWLLLLMSTCFIRKIHLSVLHGSMAIFIGLYLIALNTLSQTAHYGGKMVHKYGVHSQLFDMPISGPDKK